MFANCIMTKLERRVQDMEINVGTMLPDPLLAQLVELHCAPRFNSFLSAA
jgi:hypothetical protein